MSSEKVEVTLEILSERPNSYEVTDGDVTCFLPRSLVAEKEHLRDGTYAFYVPEWWARREDLI